MTGDTVLHIGYDSLLIELRERVLERGGYRVASALGNQAARESAKSHRPMLVVIGSGGHYGDRAEIAAWLLENLPGTPVLVMCAAPDEQFPDGVVQFYGDTPNDWLVALQTLLHKLPDPSKL